MAEKNAKFASRARFVVHNTKVAFFVWKQNNHE